MPSWHCTALQVDYQIEWTNGEGTFTREFSYDEQGLLAVRSVGLCTPTTADAPHRTARHGTGGQSPGAWRRVAPVKSYRIVSSLRFRSSKGNAKPLPFHRQRI
jgi:hypothetical protein